MNNLRAGLAEMAADGFGAEEIRSPVLSGMWRIYGRTVAFVLIVLFSIGVIGYGMSSTLPLMLKLTPWFGWVTGLLVLLPSLAVGGWRFALWLAGAWFFAFWAEAAGAATGTIFGTYEYGPTLGPPWQGVSLLIVFNWVILMHGMVCIAGRILPLEEGPVQRMAISLLAGVLAVGFEFLMEPVAVRLDFWHWAGGTAPLQNYVAWFVIVGLTALFHPRWKCRTGEWRSVGRLAGFYVLLQALLYAAMRGVWFFRAV